MKPGELHIFSGNGFSRWKILDPLVKPPQDGSEHSGVTAWGITVLYVTFGIVN
jgi:hypothetical protein